MIDTGSWFQSLMVFGKKLDICAVVLKIVSGDVNMAF